MNIFITSTCPAESAQFLDDKRCIKMCLESAQMLATAMREHGGNPTYKSTHVNHPSNVWARQTKANYQWLLDHFKALCTEYTNRYGKVHKCEDYINEFTVGVDLIPDGELTPFANCAANASLGVSYKHIDNVVLAYQLYLNERWDNDKREPTWYGKAA